MILNQLCEILAVLGNTEVQAIVESSRMLLVGEM
jgi:hypothetical protein